MFGLTSGLTIGRLAGVEIRLNGSLLLLALLVTLAVSAWLPAAVPGVSGVGYLVAGLFAALIFMGSVLWHEMAHVVTALRYQLPVRQVTLHMYGGIAELTRDPERPAHEFWIAIAGPLSSLALAVFFGINRSLPGLVGAICGWLAGVNLTLAVFNLLPGFPLDGGRVLRAVLWARSGSYKVATQQASRVGQVVAALFALFALWMLLGGLLFNALWFFGIAFLVYQMATAMFRMASGTSMPMTMPVRRVMRFPPNTIDPRKPIAFLAWKYFDRDHDQPVIVLDEGQVVGLVTFFDIDRFPRLEWGRIHVNEVMQPRDRIAVLDVDDTIGLALDRFDKTGTSYAPVLDGTVLVGVVFRRDIVYRT